MMVLKYLYYVYKKGYIKRVSETNKIGQFLL